ncbi:hypothetical protein AB0D11_48800 [Streptomyces monashensis]
MTHKTGPNKGQPALNDDGTPKIGYLEKECPNLRVQYVIFRPACHRSMV